MKKIKRMLHNMFVPHEHNNYKARLLHTDVLSVFLIAALLINFILNQPYSGQVLGYATDITVEKLFQLTNEQRAKNGLTPLTYNDQLANAAAEKAKDMFSKNYWAHYSPDGATPWTFILNSGYKYEYAGENLAKNFMFSDGVVNAWMDSPSHRENILRKEYTEVGFAISNGTLNGEETTLVVQMFGKPLMVQAAQDPQPAAAEKVAVEEKPEVVPQQAYQVDTAPVVAQKPGILGTRLLPAYLNLNIIFISLLMLVLMIDLYIAVKMRFVRIGGKNLIHFVFLGFIILALLIIQNGSVI